MTEKKTIAYLRVSTQEQDLKKKKWGHPKNAYLDECFLTRTQSPGTIAKLSHGIKLSHRVFRKPEERRWRDQMKEVATAHHLIETGHMQGKIVLEMP